MINRCLSFLPGGHVAQGFPLVQDIQDLPQHPAATSVYLEHISNIKQIPPMKRITNIFSWIPCLSCLTSWSREPLLTLEEVEDVQNFYFWKLLGLQLLLLP